MATAQSIWKWPNPVWAVDEQRKDSIRVHWGGLVWFSFYPPFLHFFGGGGRILLYRSGWPQTHHLPNSSPSVFQAMGLQLCAITPGALRFFSVKMDMRWGSSIISLSLPYPLPLPFFLSLPFLSFSPVSLSCEKELTKRWGQVPLLLDMLLFTGLAPSKASRQEKVFCTNPMPQGRSSPVPIAPCFYCPVAASVKAASPLTAELVLISTYISFLKLFTFSKMFSSLTSSQYDNVLWAYFSWETHMNSCSPQIGTPDRPKYDFTESCLVRKVHLLDFLREYGWMVGYVQEHG